MAPFLATDSWPSRRSEPSPIARPPAAGSSGASSSGRGGTLGPEELARLAADARWQRSRFEDLERFIFDFLVGGSGGQGAAAAAAEANGEQQHAGVGC